MFAKLNKVQFAVCAVPFLSSYRINQGTFGQLALLVGSSGLEPPTLRLSGVRSNHLSYEPLFKVVRVAWFNSSTPGGDEEDRTPDPLRARQVLSQLSYTPIKISFDSHQMKFAKQGFAWFALGFRNAALPFSF